MAVSYEVKPTLTIGLRNPTARYLPSKARTYIHGKTSILMFIAVLYIVAKKWGEPKCPSTEEWNIAFRVNKLPVHLTIVGEAHEHNGQPKKQKKKNIVGCLTLFM